MLLLEPQISFFFSSHQSGQVVSGRQQTITIHDTPSPAVSVITISDSEDEAPGKW
jgi:homeodomain interacting protein kinase